MAICKGYNHIDGHKELGSGTHLKEEKEGARQEGGRKNYVKH